MTLQEIQLLNHCDTESQQTIHSWLDRRQVVIERRNQLKPVYQPLMAMAMMHNA
jgi:hypothetical protein